MPAPNSTLEAIESKVRILTRSPSEQQLSTTNLDNYINTFVVYDFPEHLRTFQDRTQFTFFCNPYQDVYVTDTSIPTTDPLYNFQNIYLTMHTPVYIAGYQVLFSQSREQFFGIYPLVNSISSIGPRGDGVTTTFSGTITNAQGAVIIQNQVLFSSVDINNNGLALIDQPIGDGLGNLVVPGFSAVQGTINYLTGQFNLTFPTAPGAGKKIDSQSVPTVPTIPQAMLFYNNQFTLRPVPDQPYRINFEAYMRPTYLLDGQSPQLEELWQYIAYGAAKKIMEDRLDVDGVAAIMPEYKQQERLCLRRTLVQYTNERTPTIYIDQTQWGWGASWGYGSGGGSF